MRLFIAIPLGDAMRKSLTAMQADLRAQRVRGNFTPPENLHLTLAFIGEYPDPDGVLEILPPLQPFELRLNGFGAFGDLWWAGFERSEPLENYVRRLRRALAEAGIPFDRKRFSPHVTLVRRAEGRPVLEVPPTSMTVTRVCLMCSDRGRSGMIYTELGCREALI